MSDSFGRPEHNLVSETSVFSYSRRPEKLASSAASILDNLMMKEKRDRDESINQILRDRENLQRILEKTADSSIREEDDARKKIIADGSRSGK